MQSTNRPGLAWEDIPTFASSLQPETPSIQQSTVRVCSLRKQGCYLKFWKASNASWGIMSRVTHHRASWFVNTRGLKLNCRPCWQAAVWGTWSHSVVKHSGLSLLSGDQCQEGIAWSCARGSVGCVLEKRFFTQRMDGHWNRLSREAVTAPRSVWTTPSGTWCDSWGWPAQGPGAGLWWCLWVLSNSEHFVTPAWGGAWTAAPWGKPLECGGWAARRPPAAGARRRCAAAAGPVGSGRAGGAGSGPGTAGTAEGRPRKGRAKGSRAGAVPGRGYAAAAGARVRTAEGRGALAGGAGLRRGAR